ncbi:MAG: hypothetical protein HY217_06655 [Candidatus Rokubacteria bacterium]|nr:hypothetical protein [Candidatus Rokubacteria bacterium]
MTTNHEEEGQPEEGGEEEGAQVGRDGGRLRWSGREVTPTMAKKKAAKKAKKKK